MNDQDEAKESHHAGEETHDGWWVWFWVAGWTSVVGSDGCERFLSGVLPDNSHYITGVEMKPAFADWGR